MFLKKIFFVYVLFFVGATDLLALWPFKSRQKPQIMHWIHGGPGVSPAAGGSLVEIRGKQKVYLESARHHKTASEQFAGGSNLLAFHKHKHAHHMAMGNYHEAQVEEARLKGKSPRLAQDNAIRSYREAGKHHAEVSRIESARNN